LLDDDDLYLPGKLALEATFLQAHSAVDLVGTGVSVEGALGPVGTWEPWRSRSAPSLLGLLLDGNGFLTCSVLFRRQVLNRMDHWFDPELEWAEDADFFVFGDVPELGVVVVAAGEQPVVAGHEEGSRDATGVAAERFYELASGHVPDADGRDGHQGRYRGEQSARSDSAVELRDTHHVASPLTCSAPVMVRNEDVDYGHWASWTTFPERLERHAVESAQIVDAVEQRLVPGHLVDVRSSAVPKGVRGHPLVEARCFRPQVKCEPVLSGRDGLVWVPPRRKHPLAVVSTRPVDRRSKDLVAE
jgi:hypothetical protein